MVVSGIQEAALRRVIGVAPRRHAIAAALAAATVAACGGGGGDSTAAQATPETSQSSGNAGGDSGPTGSGSGGGATTAPAPLRDNPQSFSFAVAPGLAEAGALDAFGGTLVAGWDVSDAAKMMQPGMKVVFYGDADGCAAGTRNGPVTAGGAALQAAALSKVGLASTPAHLTWSPTAGAAGCSAPSGSSNGGAYAAIDAATSGGLALYTPTGLDATGRPQFFRPFGAGGQNGVGDNAFIAGTFVSFRQDWSAAQPRRPWAGRGDGSASLARLRSTQSVRTADVGADAGESTPVQVKQQMMATFINTACTRQGAPTAQRPCQVQYLLNTAIVRTGVTDWSAVAWYQNGAIQFDPVQGGMPVVEGPIGAAGSTTADGSTGLALFGSQGAATQHGPFATSVFDVVISFEQLQNVLRVIVGKKLGVAPTAVAAADLATTWGPQYADPASWALVSTDVAQESYNPISATHSSTIGGVVNDLFVGPQF